MTDATARFRHALPREERRKIEGNETYEEWLAKQRARSITDEYELFVRSKGKCVPDMPKVER